MFRRLSETGLDSYLVGRGNLNRSSNYMINNRKYRFLFYVEYFLEYRHAGFELRMSSVAWIAILVLVARYVGRSLVRSSLKAM